MSQDDDNNIVIIKKKNKPKIIFTNEEDETKVKKNKSKIIFSNDEEDETKVKKNKSKIIFEEDKEEEETKVKKNKSKIIFEEDKEEEKEIKHEEIKIIPPKITIHPYPTIEDDKTVYQVAFDYIPPGWEDEFNSKKAEIKNISKLIEKCSNKGEVLPQNKDIFRAFYLTHKIDVRVIILGQDPYPTPGYANGLAFSVNDDVEVPKSLINIYKEIENCYPETCNTPIKMSNSGNLEYLANQGVFLLNTCLTVPSGNAGGHTKPQNIWLPFISHILESVTKYNKDIFVLLWGKHAQSMLPYIKSRKDRILQSVHPSPLSAYRGFMGCKHFSIINDNITPPQINWQN